MRITVIIPAAGRSERFGTSDKLQQDLGGRPLLMRTVEAFARRDEVGQILVVGPPGDLDAFRERFGPALGFHGARIVAGAMGTRAESVANAIGEVTDDATHIAVHDAARPAVSQELITRVFQTAESLVGVAPAVAISSTVKRVEEEVDVEPDEEDGIADSILGDVGRVRHRAYKVVETLDRRGLMAVQTPQVFQADVLRRAYGQPLEGATDDAALVERLGEPVYLVEGDAANIKVTTPEDLRLVRAILGVKPPAERPVHKQF